MGQKVNPIGFRLLINKSWSSRWFAKKDYADLLLEDIKIREFIEKKLKAAGIAEVTIERPSKRAIITIHASRPGVIIGKKGEDIEKLKKLLQSMTKSEVSLNILEVRKPELDANLTAQSIAQQLEKRISYRRAMKKAMQSTLKMGALGIRARVSGRLGGAEIARSEEYREGSIPLHTLRADVDYALAKAQTAYGIIGVKVWIYRQPEEDKKQTAKKVEEK